MRGTSSTSATTLTPKLVCSCVCLNRLFSTTLALASRLSVMIRLVLPPELLSFTSAMPSSSPASTSSWIRLATDDTLIWYGISVTMIWYPPRLPSSIAARARIFTLPLPVRYASMMPARPRMSPPVGKSGPLTNCIRSSGVAPGLLIRWTVASMTSPRLCGGMLVAMPTAMPWLPLTSRLGKRAGRTDGSSRVPS